MQHENKIMSMTLTRSREQELEIMNQQLELMLQELELQKKQVFVTESAPVT